MDNPLEDLETFRTDPSGRLLEIGQKPERREQIQGQFMGLLRFTPQSWDWVGQTLRRPLPKPAELWLECDTQQDILTYEQCFPQILRG